MDPILQQLLSGNFDQRFNQAYTDPAIALQLQNQALGYNAPPALPPPAVPPPAAPGGATLGSTLEPALAGQVDVANAGATIPANAAPTSGLMPTGTPQAPSGGTAQTQGLLGALRGVQAPKPPEAQKVSTPHPPQQRPIQGGELINMLAAMGIGPRDVWTPPRIKVPGLGG